jgi:hypothetical protein
VRLRELFLQELDQMIIGYRSDIQNQLGRAENAVYYKGFILDPIVNQ